MTEMRKARCLCGAVRFEAPLSTGDDGAIDVGACHCGMCRRWSGGAPLLAIQPAGDVRFESEDSIGLYRGSPWGERGFCKSCGTNLFWRTQDGGHMSLAAGSFEDTTGFRLSREIFIDRKPDFYAFAGERRTMTEAEVMAAYAPKS